MGNQVFDITPFLSMLIEAGGNSSFDVNMKDNNGEAISKTLKLKVQ